MQSIREAYGFGEDADVVAQCSDGTITVSERRPDGSYHRQEISGAEMREKHLVNRVEDTTLSEKSGSHTGARTTK